jgi:hypothetical protein
MNEKFTFDDLKQAVLDGANKVCNTVVDKGGQLYEWGINNPEKIIAGIGVGTMFLRATQSLVVSHRVKMQHDYASRTYYDPSNRLRWDLRRRMTNADRIAITNRRAAGESIVDILQDLKLIK